LLDKHSQKLLSYINAECENGSYKVITVEDLMAVFSGKYRPTADVVAELIEELKRKKFIVVKYKDESSYLLTSTQSGKNFSFSEEPVEIKFKIKHILFFAAASLASGILGGLTVGLFFMFFV